jgi:hypothetical protein
MSLHKKWKNFDCIFKLSVKSYIRNTIYPSYAKILFPNAINKNHHQSQLYLLCTMGFTNELRSSTLADHYQALYKKAERR